MIKGAVTIFRFLQWVRIRVILELELYLRFELGLRLRLGVVNRVHIIPNTVYCIYSMA